MANPDCVKIEQRLKTTAARCPSPQNGTMNNRSWPKDVNESRYEKPVQTPYWGAEVTNPDCITFEQRMKTTTARCPIPQNGMTTNRSWPKDINKNRYEKPVQTPSRGAEVTKPNCVTIEQRNRSWPKDLNKNRYEKPVQTPSRGAEVTKPNCVTIEQRNRSWPKDINKNRYEKPVQTPSRGAEVANPECVKIEQRLKTTAARCPSPQNGKMAQGRE